jgi:DNA repair protein RadC
MNPKTELLSIQQLPPDMRPREKLLKLGANALTDTELLALFLRTGIKGKSVFAMAQELLDRFKGFAGLIHASASELKTFKGMGETPNAHSCWPFLKWRDGR